jgi:hypothetical protein
LCDNNGLFTIWLEQSVAIDSWVIQLILSRTFKRGEEDSPLDKSVVPTIVNQIIYTRKKIQTVQEYQKLYTHQNKSNQHKDSCDCWWKEAPNDNAAK